MTNTHIVYKILGETAVYRKRVAHVQKDIFILLTKVISNTSQVLNALFH